MTYDDLDVKSFECVPLLNQACQERGNAKASIPVQPEHSPDLILGSGDNAKVHEKNSDIEHILQ